MNPTLQNRLEGAKMATDYSYHCYYYYYYYLDSKETKQGRR